MGRSDSRVDVAIVGAGPAGASAAIMLARAGRSVLMIEKQRFPREKVCGGCLSGSALLALRALLGPDRPLPGVAGSLIAVVLGDHRSSCDPRGRTWMSPRAQLDARLCEAASSAGACVRFGEPARFARGDFGWDVLVGEDRIQATTILIASGLGGLSRQVGICGRGIARPMLAQQWVQPAESPLPPLGAVELHWLHGGYVGLATPDSGRCVVAIAARAAMVAGRTPFEGLRRLNPRASIWDMLPSDAPRRYGARGAAGFPWIPQRLGAANVLLIGDAAGYPEPFSGAGIGQALYSAQCAAQALLEGGDLQIKYAARMRPHTRMFRRTRIISSVLNRVVPFLPTFKVLPVVEWCLSRCVERIHVRGNPWRIETPCLATFRALEPPYPSAG